MQDRAVRYVVGHKNPDTDSVCSAIGYAYLKSKISGHKYEPIRAGHLNEETRFVLESQGIEKPRYVKDVRPQVRDIEIHKIEGVNCEISVKEAWNIMNYNDVVTLPVTENQELLGLVTVSDITKSYFDIYDSDILSKAKTSFKNIIETLEGQLIEGDSQAVFDKGNVVIATANPDMMELSIKEGDMVILGNRYEAQLCAIELNARAIIVCEGAKVGKTIKMLASQNNCMIIETRFDTYTVARLINQSLPIRYFLRHIKNLVLFKLDDFVEDIQPVMAKYRFRDFPIIDEDNKYIGMISRRNVLKPHKKKLILVDHNEKTQAIDGIETATILEIIDHHRIGSLETISPVYFRNEPLGCTATIVYRMYKEAGLVPDKKIAGLLCSAIISDTLIFKSPTCTNVDVDACHELAELADINIEEYGRAMFKAGSNLASKSPEEIVALDFKRFTINDTIIGVGQVNVMSEVESKDILEKCREYVSAASTSLRVNILYFMVTNVLKECSRVLCSGEGADDIIEQAFSVKVCGSEAYLEGLVSRKKQFVPLIMDELQQ